MSAELSRGNVGCHWAKVLALQEKIIFTGIDAENMQNGLEAAIESFGSNQKMRALCLLSNSQNALTTFEQGDALAWKFYGQILHALANYNKKMRIRNVEVLEKRKMHSLLTNPNCMPEEIDEILKIEEYRVYICSHSTVDTVFNMTPAMLSADLSERLLLMLAMGPHYPRGRSTRWQPRFSVYIMYRSDITEMTMSGNPLLPRIEQWANRTSGITDFQRGYHIPHPPLDANAPPPNLNRYKTFFDL